MLWIDLEKNERLAILANTSANTGMNENAIEKDWWVSMILKALFQTSCSDHLVFKGGTSLSKGWNIIDRFSEDIDIALDRSFFGYGEVMTTQKIYELRRKSYHYIGETLLGELDEQLKKEKVHGYTILFDPPKDSRTDPIEVNIKYDSILPENEYVKPNVKIEFGCRSLREPYLAVPMRSIIAENYPKEDFAETPFNIDTVDYGRTFLEKIFLLHEEYQKETPRTDRMTRHLYDLEKLMSMDNARNALSDQELYLTIVKHREEFNALANVNYKEHHPSRIQIVPPAKVLDAWRSDYEKMRESFIYGDSLSFDELIGRLQALQDTIRVWDIKHDFFD